MSRRPLVVLAAASTRSPRRPPVPVGAPRLRVLATPLLDAGPDADDALAIAEAGEVARARRLPRARLTSNVRVFALERGIDGRCTPGGVRALDGGVIVMVGSHPRTRAG